jgi:hypothetical protein
MEKFEIYLDTKTTIWTRSSNVIEAESLEEATKIAIEKYESGNYFDDFDSGCEYEHLYESEEQMSVEENGGNATEELYVEGVLIKTNGK